MTCDGLAVGLVSSRTVPSTVFLEGVTTQLPLGENIFRGRLALAAFGVELKIFDALVFLPRAILSYVQLSVKQKRSQESICNTAST